MRALFLFLIGLLFGMGILVSGMVNPAKVLSFFDIAGAWDPSLAFVMGGALGVVFIGYRVLFARRAQPFMAAAFQVPAGRQIDARLIGGAAVFGIGWAIAGFCPGAALPALGTGRPEVGLFVGALIVGMALARGGMALAARRG